MHVVHLLERPVGLATLEIEMNDASAPSNRKPPPRMSRADIKIRKQDKETQILRLLASETYTSVANTMSLCGVSRPVADATLRAMEKAHLIKSEGIYVHGRRQNLFGITDHGFATIDREGKVFELGRTAPSGVEHKLGIQKMRIAAQKAGYKDWKTERYLRQSRWGTLASADLAKELGRKLKRGKQEKLPDAVCTDPVGRIVAVEIENFAKSRKRYEDVLANYFDVMKKGHCHLVHYICPHEEVEKIRRAISKVRQIRLQGERIDVTESLRARFQFFTFEQWPPVATVPAAVQPSQITKQVKE